jgi:protein phosphatase
VRQPSTIDKALPADLDGIPMTCLHCGTLNAVQAERCSVCNSRLIAPDPEFKLIARCSARTNVGQVRKNNEDNISLWAYQGIVLALVADGLGGEAAGEVASRLAVEAVQADFLGEERDSQNLDQATEDNLVDRLEKAIQEANLAVFEQSQNDSQLKGMGTTSTMTLVRGNRVFVAHVGDSRAYLVDGHQGWIHQITSDHSFSQALLANGHITPEQAATHPMGHVLYRALGQSPDLEVDIYIRYVKAGDRIVMCSDGLTRHLQPADIVKITLGTQDPGQATNQMIDLTNARGGEDNVSVIVIQFDEV